MKDNKFFFSNKYSFSSWMMCMIAVVVLASLLTGCSRSRQFQKIREEYPHKLRVVVSNFSADSKQIFIEDVANLSDYYRDKLEQTGLFSVERDSDIIDSFSIPSIAEDTNLMRKLSQNNLIEGVISGTIKRYYYKKERRSFSIALALDIEVHDTYNGEKLYSTSKSYNRKFRLKRKGQKDYSNLNQQLLDQVLGQINNEMIIEISKIIEERKELNGGEFTTVMSGKETRNLLLWPKDAIKVSTNGSTRVGNLPIPNIRSLSTKKEGDSQKLDMDQLASGRTPKIVEPKYSPKKKKEFNSDDLLDMGFDNIAKKTSEPKKRDNFHLKIKGFKLVYPLEWDSSKKYSKFYYLVDSEKYRNKDIVDIDASMEDNLVLEVFSTVDRLAVRRFLDDYFQGISSNPIGKILEVYERSYMGKLQIGFVLSDKAVIASIHRKHREALLQGLTGLYIKNGGVSVDKLVQESIKRRFSNNGLILPDELPVKKLAKVVKKPVKKAQTILKPVKKKIRQAKVPKFSNQDLIKQKISQSMPKTISIAKKPRARVKSKPRARKPKVVKKKSSKMIPANAVFFYDMAKRRFEAHDYESAYRYFNLALEKGYDLPEVHDYLFKIEKIQSGEVDSSANDYVSGATELSTEGFITNLEYEDSEVSSGKRSQNYQYEVQQSNNDRQLQPRYQAPVVQSPVQNQRSNFNPRPPVQQYEQEAYQSISTDVNFAKPTITLPKNNNVPTIKKKSKMDEFFNEMEDMEKELQSLLNKKKGLFTVNKSVSTGGFWGFFFQFMAVVSLSLGLFSFILTKNIK
ncbi:MAG: hypothetical protein KC646_15710 [Candidatus Cloacimonetes bacterium]|nr:hypothetical protein [Candidatus Cloacimonadota bacterium]